MTTTIVFGQASDGYLYSTAATNAAAASGTAITLTAGSTGGYTGQWYNSTQGYRHHQTFFGFTFTAIAATDLLTAAEVRLTQTTTNGPSITRALELRGYAYAALATADWRTGAQLAALSLFGRIGGVQGAANKTYFAGSDDQLAAIQGGVTAMEYCAVTDRQRAGNAPTADESAVLWLSEGAGTTSDPALILTTVARSTLVPVLGGQCTLSDGTWLCLKSTGTATPTITVNWVQANGTETLISTLPMGSTSTAYDYGDGAQSIALAVDSADNFYLVGREGSANNSIMVRAYAKNASPGSWTIKNLYPVAMPSYDATINNVACAWHNISGGTLMVVAGHTSGFGVTGSTGNEVGYLLLSSSYLLTNGTGTLIRGSGSALGQMLPALSSTDFNSYANQTGTGLDCVAFLGSTNPGWGAVGSFEKGVRLGSSGPCSIGRYVLNSTGTGFTHASASDDVTSGVKDANAKIRTVAIDSQVAAMCSSNSDAGDGVSISIERFSGTTSGSVQLGYLELSGEGIATMPNAANIASVSTWDVIYNASDNRLWVYYVSAADPRVLMRTAVDLSTYNPVRNEVVVATVGAAGSVIQAIRVARNSAVTTNCLVTVAYKTSASVLSTQYVVDAYAIAPNAPVLVAKANYDAGSASTYSWAFSDPNPTDTQSAYELQIQDVATGINTVATGSVASTVSSRTVAANTLTNNKQYQWRVRTTDSTGLVGAWSAYSTFQTSTGGAVTIVDPVADNLPNIISAAYRVAWTVTGTTQASYRVKVVRTSNGATLSDSGFLSGTQTFYQTPGGMLSDVEYQIQVTVRNASNVESGTALRLITPSFANPPVPGVSVNAVDDGGYVQISADNPLPGAAELGVTPDSFESGVTGYTTTSGTLAQSALQAHDGTKSALFTTTGTPTSAYFRVANTAAVAINPGGRYTARYWVYSAAGYASVGVSIDWLTSAKALISTTVDTAAVPAGQWTERIVTGQAPTNAAYAVVGPTLSGSPATGTQIYVDELVLLLANDIPDASYNQVLRRVAGSNDAFDVLGQFEPDGEYHDYTAAGGLTYEYRVVAVGA